MNDRVRIFDNFLPQRYFDRIVEECYHGTSLQWKPQGSHSILSKQMFYLAYVNKAPQFERIFQLIKEVVPEVYWFRRCYFNWNPPSIDGEFHQDDADLTALLYVAPDYNPERGGWTQVQNRDGTIHLIEPIPNRLAVFPADLLHKGHAFKRGPRFTLTYKMTLS